MRERERKRSGRRERYAFNSMGGRERRGDLRIRGGFQHDDCTQGAAPPSAVPGPRTPIVQAFLLTQAASHTEEGQSSF